VQASAGEWIPAFAGNAKSDWIPDDALSRFFRKLSA